MLRFVTDIAARLSGALRDRYSVERQIGEGAMGAVFLATDLRHNRPVAIKVLQPAVAALIGAARFLQEIRIVARLEHPHILPLFDSGELDGLLYFVMPFVEGESLRDRLRREPQLPLGDALRIGAEVADALDYAHKRGIVHRDIKPDNIMLADGHAKVADFGIARSMSSSDTHLTQTGLALGTPAYMSPEQFLGDVELDGRSDQYSLGCVLFEMLTGTPPALGPSVQAIIAKRITQDAERVSTVRANVPPAVDLAVVRALARDPADRHATAGDLSVVLFGAISGATPVALADSSVTTQAVRRSALVGRTRDLDGAREMLAGLRDGRGGVLLIGGEPGIGKTRLSQTILDEARQRGALCLVGRCYDMEGMQAYTPFAEVLDGAARVLSPPVFREVIGDAAPEIARLQPALRAMYGDIASPLELPPDRQRAHLHATFREFLTRATRVAPMAVLLDDLHWADDASLALLQHTATYIDTIPLVVLGTFRDAELDANRPFARAVEALVSQRLARRILLKRLATEDVAELLAALGGGAPPSGLVRAIYAETEGNPFFVEEVFAHLEEEGRLFDANGAWRTDLRIEDLDVPESVRLVIGRRLERLPDIAVTTLRSAAVIGSRFALSTLKQMAELSEDALLDALDAAAQAHLIVEQRAEREVTYAFSHELIRQTLLSALSAPRRQRRHLAAANAIERALGQRAATRAVDIAYHLYQAGPGADPDRTIHFLALAAEQACSSTAFAEALAHVDRASTLDGATDTGALARCECARSNALEGLGRWPESVVAFQKTLELAIAAGDTNLITSSAVEIAFITSWSGDFAPGLAVCERAYDSLPPTAVCERSLVMARLATQWSMVNFDYAGGKRRFVEAMAIAATVREPWVIGMIRSSFMLVPYNFARFDEAAATATLAIEALADARHRQANIDTRGLRHTSYYYTAQWAALRDESEELGRMADECGSLGARFMTDVHRVWMSADDWIMTERLTRDSLTRWVAAGPWAYLCQTPAAIAQLVRGDVTGALSTCEEFRAQFKPFNPWTGFIEMGEIVCAAHHSEEAVLRRMREFAPLTPAVDPIPTMGSASYGLGLAVAHHVRGDRQALAALRPALQAILDAGYRVNFWWIVESVVGLASTAVGEYDVAERQFESAIALGKQIGHRLALPYALDWYAFMLSQRGEVGDQERSYTLLAQAQEAYTAVGMSAPSRRG